MLVNNESPLIATPEPACPRAAKNKEKKIEIIKRSYNKAYCTFNLTQLQREEHYSICPFQN